MKKLLLVLMTILSLTSIHSKAFAEECCSKYQMTVSGIGQVTAAPDAVNLSATVQTQQPTMEAARQENAQKMKAVLQRVKGLGIPNLVIQTNGYNANPVRDYSEKGQKRGNPIIGYQVTNNVSMKIEGAEDADKLAENAGRLMDASLQGGANNTSGPNFYLSHNNKAQLEALKLAIAQAKQTADTIAASSGVTLIGVYNIETSQQMVPMRSAAPMAMMKLSADASSEPTPIEAGQFDVNANVTIKYEFRNNP